MGLVNYCKKCKTEVPTGDSCPYCGGRLTRAGEQLSFGAQITPLRDWFHWNDLLRIGLAVLGLTLVATVAAEAAAAGQSGVIALIAQGFGGVMMGLLAALLVLIAVLLHLRGEERVHYVLDKQGVHARTYVADPSPVQLFARFTSPDAADKLAQADSRQPLPGLTLVRRTLIPWSSIRRVRIWREGGVVLLFRPAYWQVLAVRCPSQELAQVESYVRAKLKRSKKVRVLPMEKTEKR